MSDWSDGLYSPVEWDDSQWAFDDWVSPSEDTSWFDPGGDYNSSGVGDLSFDYSGLNNDFMGDPFSVPTEASSPNDINWWNEQLSADTGSDDWGNLVDNSTNRMDLLFKALPLLGKLGIDYLGNQNLKKAADEAYTYRAAAAQQGAARSPNFEQERYDILTKPGKFESTPYYKSLISGLESQLGRKLSAGYGNSGQSIAMRSGLDMQARDMAMKWYPQNNNDYLRYVAGMGDNALVSAHARNSGLADLFKNSRGLMDLLQNPRNRAIIEDIFKEYLA